MQIASRIYQNPAAMHSDEHFVRFDHTVNLYRASRIFPT